MLEQSNECSAGAQQLVLLWSEAINDGADLPKLRQRSGESNASLERQTLRRPGGLGEKFLSNGAFGAAEAGVVSRKERPNV